MGYTHYYSIPAWSEPEWQGAWPKLITDTSIIIRAAEVPLSGPGFDIEDYSKPPTVNIKNGIHVNGIEEDAHEPLIINRDTKWSFVKTARKPYDIVVCCILLRAYMLAPHAFQVSSDGYWDEWNHAKELYHRLWPNETLVCPWGEERS